MQKLLDVSAAWSNRFTFTGVGEASNKSVRRVAHPIVSGSLAHTVLPANTYEGMNYANELRLLRATHRCGNGLRSRRWWGGPEPGMDRHRRLSALDDAELPPIGPCRPTHEADTLPEIVMGFVESHHLIWYSESSWSTEIGAIIHTLL